MGVMLGEGGGGGGIMLAGGGGGGGSCAQAAVATLVKAVNMAGAIPSLIKRISALLSR